MTPAPLACTVRGCALPLAPGGATWTCPRGHSYDVARSGYLNLLQPQDRKSAVPGDARSAVEARIALERAGAADALVSAIAAQVVKLPGASGAIIADLGCGTGMALATVAGNDGRIGIGIDLSSAAIAHAARRHPGLTWVVANADRRLPLLDDSLDILLSLHGRRNAAEAARVLRPGGVLIAAVPAADDVIELRAAVQGSAEPRDRVPALVEEHDARFALVDRFRVVDRRTLGREALLALLNATYRGARRSAALPVERLEAMDVTLASDVCVLSRRAPGG
jgi:23S rRNA (guanine745-N1)-methyltransferase